METTRTQNYTQIQIAKTVSTICLSLIFGSLLMLSACTMPGGNQKISKIRLSIQNTLPISRKNVPIVLTGAQLRSVNPDFSFKAYSVVTGKAPREVMIPAQADDLDYNGESDQLCFLLDLGEGETKEVSILYDPTVKATLTLDINKQTRAAIFPELNAIAAIESNLIAYVLKPNGAFTAYGKKRMKHFSMDAMFQMELDQPELDRRPLSPELRHHFESNKISLSQQVQIEKIQKPEQQWVVRDLENQETYFIRKSPDSEISDLGQEIQTDGQLNVVQSIGLSLNALLNPETTEMIPLNASEGLIGCGGIALWHHETEKMIPLPTEGNYVRILADGSVRSIVQRIVPEWELMGETRRLTLTTFIYGENPWIEHHIHIDGNLPTDYAIATGIPNLQGAYKEDREQGWIWSWGTDPRGIDTLGIALIVPTGRDAHTNTAEKDDLLPVILTPDEDGRLSYRTFAIWGGGIDGISTEAAFAEHVQTTTTFLKTPPRIKFLPQEEEK